MANKIGHDYNRDPYPWDGAEKLASSAKWTCCDMELSPTFYVCPMCGKERDFGTDDALTENAGE